MKRNAASHSAFFNLRLSLTFLLCSAGLLLAVVGFGANENILLFGVTDINTITGTETSPNVTQSSSSVWSHGDTIVVGYNDSSGVNLPSFSICGVSTSTDGGATFNRVPYKFNIGQACFGDPQVYYSIRAAKWFYNAITGACGGQGVKQWSSPDGISWSNGSCVFTTNGSDLPSAWVDNNAASPFFGRQYALINDLSVGGGSVRSSVSTDDGATWSVAFTVFPSFRRAVKIFGGQGAGGTVYAETQDEGAGGLTGPHQNFLQRSTDGGVTWSAAISQGAPYAPAGRSNCSDSPSFPCMYASPSSWRHAGYGQPGVGPGNVVHYTYSGGAPGDPGNVYYIRSTDGGNTWSVPLLMNTDATTRAQWGASLSVNATGQVFVSWYDERNTAGNFLERYGRASLDNGATFGTEMPLSDVMYPKPLQPDPNLVATYAGFSDFAAFSNDGNGTVAYHAWTDGRVSIAGSPQQDVFIDQIDLGAAVPFTAGDLVIYRVGDTVTPLSGNAAAVFLDEYTTTGALVQSIPMPTAVNGSHRRLTASGTATSEGFLNLSTDGRYLTATGYDANVGTADPAGSSAGAINRVIARVNDDGGIDTTTALTDAASGGNPRSAISTNGTDLWMTGSVGGVRYTTFGSTISTQLATNPANLRVTNIFAGQLYVSTAAGSSIRLGTVGTGTPTTSGQTITNLPGFLTNNGSPYAFFFADLTVAVPGNDTLYVADDNGLIRKYSLVAGTWTNNGSVALSAPRGLTGVVNGTSVTLYITNASSLQTLTDTAGYNASNNGSPVSLATARSNTAFRGVASVPTPQAPAISSAVSRKTHGGAGDFDVDLPRTGTPGIECRSGGATGDYTMIVTFANPIAVNGSPQAQVTSGTGDVGSGGTPNGGDVIVSGDTVTVPLTNVANAQTIEVTLFAVEGLTDKTEGGDGGDVVIPMSVLTGDSNANGAVNSADVSQTKSRIGQAIDGTNFRSDVNATGGINSGDVSLIKANIGNGLP